MKNVSELGLNLKSKTFIIAEIGLNHGGDLDVAFKLVDSAVRAGADAVKFQTYITEKRVATNSPIFDILKKCELSFDSFKLLKDYSESKGVIFFSTPFDEESVNYLESINVAIYKIASFDLVNNKILKKISDTGKPIILSVGMSEITEIQNALNVLNPIENKVALLHCISAYPTTETDANLSAIRTLIEAFPECIIGQSDHTDGTKIPVYSVAVGAQIIEKHYMIDDDMDCVDSPVSISEIKFKEMVSEIRLLESVLGDGIPKLTKAQEGTTPFRRFSDL